jgi:hypothetical protein
MNTLKKLSLWVILALWVVDTTFVIIFLLLESSLWYRWLLFLIAHTISVLLSLSFLSTLAEIDAEFRYDRRSPGRANKQEQIVSGSQLIGKTLKQVLFIIACLPLVGPISVLLFTVSLKYAPVRSLAIEKYEIINQDYLDRKITGIDESYYNLLTNKVIELIHGHQPYHDSRATLNLLDKLKWTPHKTRILQMLLEYNKYPSIIVGAARLINEKRNEILDELVDLNKQLKKAEQLKNKLITNKNLESNQLKKESIANKYLEPDQLKLANLYHEIYYIGLVDPHLGHFYLNKACEAIEKVIEKQQPANLSTYNMAIRYFLENKQMENAEKFINQAIVIFDKTDYSSAFESYFDEIAFLKNSSNKVIQ